MNLSYDPGPDPPGFLMSPQFHFLGYKKKHEHRSKLIIIPGSTRGKFSKIEEYFHKRKRHGYLK